MVTNNKIRINEVKMTSLACACIFANRDDQFKALVGFQHHFGAIKMCKQFSTFVFFNSSKKMIPSNPRDFRCSKASCPQRMPCLWIFRLQERQNVALHASFLQWWCGKWDVKVMMGLTSSKCLRTSKTYLLVRAFLKVHARLVKIVDIMLI